MSKNSSINVIDYLFAGAGASTTLLLMSLERRGLLQNKSIVIVDPDEKIKNDKTYCFWSNTNDNIVSHCNHLISYRWNKISVNQNNYESIQPLEYIHIKGETVYNELRRIIQQYQINRINGSVLAIDDHLFPIHIKTASEVFIAKKVFDSRPPQYLKAKEYESHLAQSFVGYVIQTNKPIENYDGVKLMDFEVNQLQSTQFVYVLPFEKNKSLVELTRFGNELISEQEAKPILEKYIHEHFGDFDILDIEIGCIPMSNAKIVSDNNANLIPIGSRAGAIKASTGYAFKNMYNHAERLAESMLLEQDTPKIKNISRFQFYDRLLLSILKNQPEYGKPIFQTLFQKNNATDVLHFIEEKTSFLQDIKILLSLPIKPFLRALFFDILFRMKNFSNPLLLFSFTILLLFLQVQSDILFSYSQIIFFSIGLFFVGIPHGALDNLVESGSIKTGYELHFIFKYLLKGLLFLMFWLIYPSAALVIFLLYSALHFGQTDMNEWKPSMKNNIQSILWGTIVLSIILIAHVSETNAILSNLKVFSIPLASSEGITIGIGLSIFGIFWGIFEKKIQMILIAFTLLLTIYLPLLTSFGLYFIGHHSIMGWSHLKNNFQATHLNLFKKALPYNVGAWLLFGLYLLFADGLWVSGFFVFISCISLPHVLAMNKFYSYFFSPIDK